MTKGVEALRRGLAVLQAVERRGIARLEELHRDTGLAKATVLRLLTTLQEEGFVRRRLADGRYMLARAVAGPGADDEEYTRLAAAAAPVMGALAERTGWPSDLAIPADGRMMILETTRYSAKLKVNLREAGFRIHLMTSALGQVYLAHCTETERARQVAILRRSDDPMDAAARDAMALGLLLDKVRRQGYGLRSTVYPGDFDAFAVPVMADGAALAALNLVWLAGAQETGCMLRANLKALRDAARAIAARYAALTASRAGPAQEPGRAVR